MLSEKYDNAKRQWEEMSEEKSSSLQELKSVRDLLKRHGYQYDEPLHGFIHGLIKGYDESLSGHRRNIESLKEENGRLWYMVGVAMKDPNTLRSYKKIGVRPSYAQPTYGEMMNQDTEKNNY